MRTIVTVCTFILLFSSSASMQQAADDHGPESVDASNAPANVNIATHLTASEVTAGFLPIAEGATSRVNILVERVGAYRLALEHRRLPQRPAAHEQEAEVWAVIEGNATITTGGTIGGAAAPTSGSATQAPGNVFGKMIIGGTLNEMRPGDYLLIPEGEPLGRVQDELAIQLFLGLLRLSLCSLDRHRHAPVGLPSGMAVSQWPFTAGESSINSATIRAFDRRSDRREKRIDDYDFIV